MSIDYQEAWKRLWQLLKDADARGIKIKVSPPSGIWAYVGMMMYHIELELKTGGRQARTTYGVEAIRRERIRQMEVEGWTAEHDDEWDDGELASAGAFYAMNQAERRAQALWPFYPSWFKPSPENRKRELEKAGALIAAELDRMDRLDQGKKEKES